MMCPFLLYAAAVSAASCQWGRVTYTIVQTTAAKSQAPYITYVIAAKMDAMIAIQPRALLGGRGLRKEFAIITARNAVPTSRKCST